MSVISGKDGTLFIGGSEVFPCSNWTLSEDGNLKPYAANDTEGWERQVAGVFKASGTFLIRADDECHCPVSKGLSYVAQFHIDGSLGNYYNGRVAIATIDVEDDINDGEIVNYVINWRSDGPMTEIGMPAEDVGCSSSSGS